MNTSSDVNTIFAYNDKLHKFHKKVSLFMARMVRGKYILLSKVKSNFLYTYKDNLATSCVIIEQAIRDYKEARRKSPSKTYKPSNLAIAKHVDSLIKKHLDEAVDIKNYNRGTVKSFISKLLSEYSIPTLLEDDNALGEFKEKYLMGAEEEANLVLNKFIRFFRARDFDLMNIENYENYDKWMKLIKQSSKKVFENKSDYEDMSIAAEFLAYNEEFKLLDFFTCDTDFKPSTSTIAKDNGLKIGRIHLIQI